MKRTFYLPVLAAICFFIFSLNAFAGSVSRYSSSIMAADISNSLSKINSSNAILPVIPLDTDDIEVSGLLYLPDLQQYLAVSDETPHNNLLLFMMDRFGRVTREINIAGLEDVIDMESIAGADDGSIYIACSSSVNDNGIVPAGRRLLITIRRTGTEFTLDQSIDLLTALSECAAANPQATWAGFISQAVADGTLDIEGMFQHEDALYLGLKAPFFNSHSIILRIAQVARLMAQQALTADQVSIWDQLDLIGDEGEQEVITDLFFENNLLFITSELGTNDNGEFSGSVWRYEPSSENLTRIIHYNDMKPEGVAAASDPTALLIGFDQGTDDSSYTMLIRGVR